MPRFLVEVPHEGTYAACVRAVEVFLQTGSHALTHADWGCKDGDHRAWLVVEVDSRDEARNVIPPLFRPLAKVIQLNAFTLKDLEDMHRPNQP